jgi:hypothetical protein
MVELDFKSCVDYYRDGNLSFVEWFQSLRGIEEFGYFRANDIKPFSRLLMTAVKRISHQDKSANATATESVYSPTITSGGEQARAVAQQS